MTYAQIAEKLNETHYLTRRHKQFDGKAIYRLIKRYENTELISNQLQALSDTVI